MAVEIGDSTVQFSRIDTSAPGALSIGGESNSTKIYLHTIAAGDNDSDGVSVEAGAGITLAAGGSITDNAGNAMTVFTHATGLPAQSHAKVDSAKPAIAFPSGAPTVGTAATITLTDATAKVAKHAVLEVDGSATNADGCDDPATDGDDFSTTAVSPAVSPKEVSHTPATAGKKICVYAEDAAGNRHAALWTTAIAAAPKPAKPAGLTATPGNAQVTLSWTDPSDSSISKYQVQQKEGTAAWGAWADISGSGAATTGHTVSSLSNGTEYRFRIRAVNAQGNGPESDVAGPATPSTSPLSKPRGLRALERTDGSGTVVLNWDPPAVGADTVLRYEVAHEKAGASAGAWSRIRGAYPTTRRVVTGLDDGVEYVFRVRAVNADGPGPASDEVRGAPGAVGVHGYVLARFRVAPAEDRLELQWQVLSGAPYCGYVVEWREAGSSGAWARYEFGTKLRHPRHAIGGLKPGTEYVVRLYVQSGYTNVAPGLAFERRWSTTGTAPAEAPAVGAPALQWARVTGAELALRFDKDLDETSAPSASAFAVSVAGASRGVSTVAVSQDTVMLTLAEAVAAGETVTVGYTPPSSGKLRRSGGGPAVAAFTGQSVTNDTPSAQPQQQAPPEAVAPLTARVSKAPAEHDGSAFAVRIRFSEAVETKAKDAGVQVSGGTLARAVRVKKRKDLWKLRVRPSGDDAVTVTLPAGAARTADGRTLSDAVTVTVSGLGPVALSVADASAREGAGATVDFAVTLSRAASGKVTVTYATRDGTARKGKDYRKAKGTLAFAAGETAKTVSVAILDDAVDEGEETFTLVLKKATGAVIADGEATGTIENDDPMPGAWLARFGRTVADQAVAAVRDRLGADRRPGFRGRIAGEALPDGTGAETAAGGGTGDGPLAVPELAEDERRAFMALLALKTGEGLEPDAGESRAVTGEEALAGTAFEFVREAGDGLSLGLWGRVARSGFSGRAGELSLDGDVATALLGTDWRRRDALFGLMLFRSRGEGGWRAPEGSGTVRASLSGLVPWAGLRRDGSPALWAAAGTGRGELTLAPEGRDPATAGLRWSMAAAGAAGAPATVDALGGARVGWRADAMAARTASEAAAGLAASGTGTTRLRLGLEAAWAGTLSPRLEIGLRHDGGDAETGFGLEAGGGVRLEDPARGLSASLDGRALALHEDGDLEDWGVSVTLEWDPRPETRLGPSVVATRGWGGAASGGVDALLGPETVPGLAAADGGAWSLEAAYGLRRGNGMAGVPHLRMGGTEGLEELRLGYRIAPDADRAADASAEIWAEPGVGGTGPRAGAGLEWRW